MTRARDPSVEDRNPGRNASVDMQQFLRNRQQFPPDELARYAGKYIAWSPDGTRILASDDDLAKVAKAVEDQGYDPSELVLSSVPFSYEVILGVGAFPESESRG
jgi:hypothetical protein